MRFSRLRAARLKPEIVLESLGCGVFAFLVTLLITQTSYEVVLVLEQQAMGRQRAVELSRVIKASYAARTVAFATKLSTNFVPTDRLVVSCRAETLSDAETVCTQVGKAAVDRYGSLRLLQSTADPPATDDFAMYAAVAALFALAWCGGRTYLGTRRYKDGSDELAGWTIKRNVPDGRDLQVAFAPSFRAPPHSQLQSDPKTATGTDASGLLTRVVFHVGGNPRKLDGLVLGRLTRARLQALAEELIAKAVGHRVLRVASGVGSRYAKTQVTAQLAAILAETTGEDVVVAEGDIDAPALHQVMNLKAPLGLGFSEQLQRLSGQDGRGTLSVVRVEGTLHALLESSACSPSAFGLPLFGAALEELRKANRFVVVDGPVVDDWPDSTHLAHGVDAVVWVTGAGTRKRDSRQLAERHFDAQHLFYVEAAEDLVATG